MPSIIEITITIGQGSTVSLISLLLNIYDHIEYCSGETFDKKNDIEVCVNVKLKKLP